MFSREEKSPRPKKRQNIDRSWRSSIFSKSNDPRQRIRRRKQSVWTKTFLSIVKTRRESWRSWIFLSIVSPAFSDLNRSREVCADSSRLADSLFNIALIETFSDGAMAHHLNWLVRSRKRWDEHRQISNSWRVLTVEFNLERKSVTFYLVKAHWAFLFLIGFRHSLVEQRSMKYKDPIAGWQFLLSQLTLWFVHLLLVRLIYLDWDRSRRCETFWKGKRISFCFSLRFSLQKGAPNIFFVPIKRVVWTNSRIWATRFPR